MDISVRLKKAWRMIGGERTLGDRERERKERGKPGTGEEAREHRWWSVSRRWGTSHWTMFVSPAASACGSVAAKDWRANV